MPGLRAAVSLAIAGFVLALLATWPLRWLTPLLPDSLECAAPTGTVWAGQCAALRMGPNALGTTGWNLRATELLRGRVGGELRVQQPGLSLQGVVGIGPTGAVHARDLRGELELGYAFIERLAPNLRGRVVLDVAEVAFSDGWIRELQGGVDVTGLQQTYPQPLALGNYAIRFAGGVDDQGRLVGQLQDRGGPLDVRGTLALPAQRGYELSGSVLARPDAPPVLAQQIQFLGSPDAEGRRPFSQSETF
jgi:general secretion pathway protein N